MSWAKQRTKNGCPQASLIRRERASIQQGNSRSLAYTPSVDCGVGNRPANDRVSNSGEKLAEVIILWDRVAIRVEIHLSGHGTGNVVRVRHTGHPSIKSPPGNYFRFALQNQ